MQTKNRIAAYFGPTILVPYDEVEDLRREAWDDGFDDGFRNGMSLWAVFGVVCFAVGVLVGWWL